MGETMTITILIVGWLACGVVSAGFAFASYSRSQSIYVRRELHYWLKNAALFDICFGAAGLFVNLIFHHSHGWLWPWSDKARKEAGL